MSANDGSAAGEDRRPDEGKPSGKGTDSASETPLITSKPRPIRAKEGRKRTKEESERAKAEREKDARRHHPPSYKVADDVNDTIVNCHGLAYGNGEFFIEPEDVGKILEDNYDRLNDDKQVRICSIMVWYNEDPRKVKGTVPEHSALVIEVEEPADGKSKEADKGKEVDENPWERKGKPTWVIGKYGDLGEVWVHQPEDYQDKHEYREVYRIKDEAVSTETEEIEWLEDEYGDAYRKWKEAQEKPEEKKEELRKAKLAAAFRLCRRRNRLKDNLKSGDKK